MDQEAKITFGLLAALYCYPVLGQAQRPAILVVDLANYVEYQGDIGDPQKFAINPYSTPASNGAKNFGVATILADIVAIIEDALHHSGKGQGVAEVEGSRGVNQEKQVHLVESF